jgi:cytochrome c oxidase assembly protein subunit 15
MDHSLSLKLPAWFKPVLGALVVEVFFLIALGGFVRLMNAGLACPDWPLCFGNYIPDYHPQVYFEFIHRAMAGLVTITTVLLALALWRSSAPRGLKLLMAAAVTLLLAQVVFGGLTVLLQLRAGVVATHLAMGTGFFVLLLWMHLVARGAPRVDVGVGLGRWTIFVGSCIYGQLLLGGLVASNYAGHVCTEFPTCQNGIWFPSFSGMLGLHLIHRLGAYFVFAVLVTNFALMRRSGVDSLRRWSSWMLVLVFVQIALGVANVLLLTPPVIGVAHLATATFLLSLGVRQVYASAP